MTRILNDVIGTRWRPAAISGVPTQRLLAIVSAISLVLYFGLGLAILIHGSRRIWVDMFFDDAYYYLGIARSIVVAHRSQFLPPYVTNGYQPLWQFTLTIVAWIFGVTDRSMAIELYLTIYGCVAMFGYVSARNYNALFPAVACIFAYPFVMTMGMETCLVGCLGLLYLSATSVRAQGLAGSLLFLARLDSLALIVAKDGVAILMGRPVAWRKYAIIAPVITGYFVLNQLNFGVAVPISGLAKGVSSGMTCNVAALSAFGMSLISPGLSGLWLAALSHATRRCHHWRFASEISALLIAQAICAFYYVTRSGWPIWPWYTWPSMLLTFFVLQEILVYVRELPSDDTKGLQSLLVLAPVVLYIVPPILSIESYYSRYRELDGSQDATATWGQENVALTNFIHAHRQFDGAFFAMGDRAGSFGFFLGRSYLFLHTEGLVGPTAYYHAMQHGNGKLFFRRSGVQFLVVDRERVFDSDDIIGIAEPVQQESPSDAPYLVCFNESSVLQKQRYRNQKRLLISVAGVVNCPAAMRDTFYQQRQRYDGLRSFALPSEESGTQALRSVLNIAW